MKDKTKTILKAIGIGTGSLGLMSLGIFMDRFWVKEKIHSYVNLARETEAISNEITSRLESDTFKDLSPEEMKKTEDALNYYCAEWYRDVGVTKALEKIEKEI